MLGRLIPENFPKIFGPNEDQSLDLETVRTLFTELTETICTDSGVELTLEEVADGFIQVANESMCRPIRALTEARGHEISSHDLAVFGGAGGQHACEIAQSLGIHRVIMHRHSSILSAYGMALAEVVQEAQEPSSDELNEECLPRIEDRIIALKEKVILSMAAQEISADRIDFECYLNLRYQGTETAVMILRKDGEDFRQTFLDEHLQEFGFIWHDDRKIMVDNIRVRGVGKSDGPFDETTSLAEALSKTCFDENAVECSANKVIFRASIRLKLLISLVECLFQGDRNRPYPGICVG